MSMATALHQSVSEEPHGILRGESGLCVALVDSKLPKHTCVVRKNGRVIVGDVAVWRFPALLPSDVETWRAVQPEIHGLDAVTIPFNAVLCSLEGTGITSLSGGDYDGDMLFFSSDPLLLEVLSLSGDETNEDLVKESQAYVTDFMAQAPSLLAWFLCRTGLPMTTNLLTVFLFVSTRFSVMCSSACYLAMKLLSNSAPEL